MKKPGVKTPRVSRAYMERAAKAIEEGGRSFAGFRLHPDGSVDALVGEPLTHPKLEMSLNPLDDELAQWDAKHG